MVWKHVLTAIGLGFCLFQVFTITKSYLEFNVISKVSLKQAENVTLPGFTYCSPIYNFWSMEVIQQYAHRISGLNNTDFRSFTQTPKGQLTIKQFITKMTISEIRSSIGQTAENLLQVHYLLNPETGLLTNARAQDFITQSFLLEGMLCQIIYPKNTELYTYPINSLRGNQNSALMVAYLVGSANINATGLSNSAGIITLTPPGKLPFGPLSGFEMVTQDESRYVYSVKYKISIAERMPPPYATKCKNYTKDGLDSEQELYQNCLNEIASRKWSSTAPGTLVPLDSAGHLIYGNVPRIGADGKQWKEALHYCAKAASQQACTVEHYSITNVSRMKMITNESIISIQAPYEPTIVTIDFPMMTTCDFLVSIGSTFGYWLEFNVVAASINCVLWCQKYGQLVKEKMDCKFKLVNRITANARVVGFVGKTDVID